MARGLRIQNTTFLQPGGLELARKYRLSGVPSVVINSEKLISYEDYGGDTAKLEALLKDAIEKASQPSTVPERKITLTVPSVLVVGFLAGFNPCLLAVLAFIASVTLAATGKRRNVLLIVLMFSLGIFATYLIVGIGLLRIIEESPSLQDAIRSFLVALIAILGCGMCMTPIIYEKIPNPRSIRQSFSSALQRA